MAAKIFIMRLILFVDVFFSFIFSFIIDVVQNYIVKLFSSLTFTATLYISAKITSNAA